MELDREAVEKWNAAIERSKLDYYSRTNPVHRKSRRYSPKGFVNGPGWHRGMTAREALQTALEALEDTRDDLDRYRAMNAALLREMIELEIRYGEREKLGERELQDLRLAGQDDEPEGHGTVLGRLRGRAGEARQQSA